MFQNIKHSVPQQSDFSFLTCRPQIHSVPILGWVTATTLMVISMCKPKQAILTLSLIKSWVLAITVARYLSFHIGKQFFCFPLEACIIDVAYSQDWVLTTSNAWTARVGFLRKLLIYARSKRHQKLIHNPADLIDLWKPLVTFPLEIELWRTYSTVLTMPIVWSQGYFNVSDRSNRPHFLAVLWYEPVKRQRFLKTAFAG